MTPPEHHELVLEWGRGPQYHVETVEGRADETVLDAAERFGVALPFGCLTGACATCTARLLDGDIEYRRDPLALKPRHRDDGFVLLCIAEARSDCRFRVGSEVQAELVTNPWK